MNLVADLLYFVSLISDLALDLAAERLEGGHAEQGDDADEDDVADAAVVRPLWTVDASSQLPGGPASGPPIATPGPSNATASAAGI